MNGFQRNLFRLANTVNVAVYRWSNGRLMSTAVNKSPVLLLTVAGRRSGTPRTQPVAYFPRNGGWAVVGSAGGDAAEPQWFRNLRAADHASVQMGTEHHDVAVRVLEGQERDEAFAAIVERAPGFAKYETKSQGRPMPVALLTPQTA